MDVAGSVYEGWPGSEDEDVWVGPTVERIERGKVGRNWLKLKGRVPGKPVSVDSAIAGVRGQLAVMKHAPGEEREREGAGPGTLASRARA